MWKAAGVGLENRDKKFAKILQIPLNPRKIAALSRWKRLSTRSKRAGARGKTGDGACPQRRTSFCLRNSASIGKATACLGATDTVFSFRLPSGSELSMFLLR